VLQLQHDVVKAGKMPEEDNGQASRYE